MDTVRRRRLEPSNETPTRPSLPSLFSAASSSSSSASSSAACRASSASPVEREMREMREMRETLWRTFARRFFCPPPLGTELARFTRKGQLSLFLCENHWPPKKGRVFRMVPWSVLNSHAKMNSAPYFGEFEETFFRATPRGLREFRKLAFFWGGGQKSG